MATIISGCHKDILLYDNEKFEPELVIFTTLIPGQQIRALITKSALPKQLDSTIFIDDAIVEVYKDDNFIGKLKFYPMRIDTSIYTFGDDPTIHYQYEQKEAYYRSDFVVETGHKYTLKVSAIGKTVEKEVVLPEKNTKTDVTLSNLIMYDTMHLDNGYIDCNFKFTPDVVINDIPGKNYYVFLFYTSNYVFDFDTVTYEYGDTIVKKYKFYTDISGSDGLADIQSVYCTLPLENRLIYTSILNDDLFSNQSYRLKADYILTDATIKEDELVKIYYQTYTVSEDYFKYFVSENKNSSSSDNPFVEPVNIYSNLDGALGVISAINVATDSIIIPVSDFTFEEFPDLPE